MINKLLIANRGEIACRVIQTARRVGIETVAVYSNVDSNALHVRLADQAFPIGAAEAQDSYLNIDKIIDVAEQTEADAIHPGYGFLSENADFARACEKNNIIFVGPKPHSIEQMGSKSKAKALMQAANVPVVPGYHGDDQKPDRLLQEANKIGYPVLLKAVAGGGGKGMRLVESEGEFADALSAAKGEARASFGDDAMLVEKCIQQPRHVEVQVFFDQHGYGVYLFERDCSIQRRHQKIIEEAPAPGLSEALRKQMGQSAVAAASAVDYVGAGTVEFLLDDDDSYYFMEMNTRLQVEHPVTEMISGEDLVEWQLRVAAGEELPKKQEELVINGHAIEARIYAEDPQREFMPSSGCLHQLEQPQQLHIRIDTGVVAGDEISPFYDPMIAKMITWGANREIARARLQQALEGYFVAGVQTNVSYLHAIVGHEAFKEAKLSTDFIERHGANLEAQLSSNSHTEAPIAALSWLLSGGLSAESVWQRHAGWRLNLNSTMQLTLTLHDELHHLRIEPLSEGNYRLTNGEEQWLFNACLDKNRLRIERDGQQFRYRFFRQKNHCWLKSRDHQFEFFVPANSALKPRAETRALGYVAPMNATVVEVNVAVGDCVQPGDKLITMEAMKMQHSLTANSAGKVSAIHFAAGDLVKAKQVLLDIEPDDE